MERDEENLEVIKALAVNNSVVLTEDNLNFFIPENICTDIIVDDPIYPNEIELNFKYFDNNTKIWTEKKIFLDKEDTEFNYVAGAESSKTGNIVLFLNSTGKAIKNSDYSITEDLNTTNGNYEIPTIAAVKDYINKTMPLPEIDVGGKLNIIYRNLDGTSKPAFKLGSKGITLSTAEVGDDNIKSLTVNGKATLSEDNLHVYIPTEMCTDIEEREDTLVFHFKEFDSVTKRWKESDKIIEINKYINVGTGGNVKGPSKSTQDAIALFADETGKNIKDSGKKISDRVTNNENDVPTATAVRSYLTANIGYFSEQLLKRLEGKKGVNEDG